MTSRLSLVVGLAAFASLLTGCRLGDSPPWARVQPNAQNPYGNQYAGRPAAPGQDPFIRNGAQHTPHPNPHQTANSGYARIPSAGHPVPNRNMFPANPTFANPTRVQPMAANSSGGVMQAGYQMPATAADPFQAQPGATISPQPNNWQPHQPRFAPQEQQSPFVQPH